MGSDAPTDAAAEQRAYEALQCYTIARGDAEFVHQHAVDAWTAQRADGATKPIALTFALVGLCLYVERGFSGRQVQRVHVEMARRKRQWPVLTLPVARGTTTAVDVMAEPAGPRRDAAIRGWCASVWAAYAGSRGAIVELLRQYGIGAPDEPEGGPR